MAAKMAKQSTMRVIAAALAILAMGGASTLLGQEKPAGARPVTLTVTERVEATVEATVDEAEAERIAEHQAQTSALRLLTAEAGGDSCGTVSMFLKRYPDALSSGKGVCQPYSPCDSPTTRNSFIPTETTPFKTIRVHFNIFRETDGSNAAASSVEVMQAVSQLNTDYAASRIRFEYTWRYVNSSQYRRLTWEEVDPMKVAFAYEPAQRLNIHVTTLPTIGDGGLLFGAGTFPWDAEALTPLGGVICNDMVVGAGQKTISHEVGHCLGLWHPHHGVSEVVQCSSCWERADGQNGDITGDFASDTPPTPVNYRCLPPPGADSCSSTPWGTTDLENLMGYQGDFCMRSFTPHQMGRMHCFLTSRLTTWWSTPAPTPTPTPAPGADTYEPDNTLATAKTLAIGPTGQSRSIDPAVDEDWIKVVVSTRQNVRFETSGPRGGDTVMELYNASGSILASNDDIAVNNYYSRISRTAMMPGTYYIRVTSYLSETRIPAYTVRAVVY